MQCANNLKQIGLAIHGYHATHGGIPYASEAWNPDLPGGTWQAFILPHLEQQGLYDRFHFDVPMKDPLNAQAVTTVVSAYVCPTDPLSAHPILTDRQSRDNPNPALGTWYSGSIGPTDMAQGNMPQFCGQPKTGRPARSPIAHRAGATIVQPCRQLDRPVWPVSQIIRFSDVCDGLTNTIMGGETLPGDCSWMGAFNPNLSISGTSIPLNVMESDNGSGLNWYRVCGFKSLHPGGTNFVMGDGSVHFLSQSIDFRTFNALGTAPRRNSGNSRMIPSIHEQSTAHPRHPPTHSRP